MHVQEGPAKTGLFICRPYINGLDAVFRIMKNNRGFYVKVRYSLHTIYAFVMLRQVQG